MGRGRQKAKQMKVARKLKYFSPDTDLDALQRELAPEDLYEEQGGDGATSPTKRTTSTPSTRTSPRSRTSPTT